MKIIPGEIPTGKLHGYLLSSVAPRPIAFASTIDKEGNSNLSPFSFFNIFGSNPPIAIFSPARRVRDNSIKHTLENVKEVPEVVINIVNYNIVQQMSLASCEYPKGTNEFEKAGLTEVASELIRPMRVAESPVQLECKVKEVIETGQNGGAGNLIVCEIVMVHINDNVLGIDGRIDANKIDLVARMGGDLYCRASGDALFEVPKPNEKLGMGIDKLPAAIKNSTTLTGNDLGMLANVEAIPARDENFVFENKSADAHQLAHQLLQENKINEAWQALLR